ncbi:hypothetical protein D6745_04715 [Candidatus Woesearchaeota archaeon]|nr:MAG: hypothetical protein D6745_04715 [Candidatus Woesearchaeota archaeon]
MLRKESLNGGKKMKKQVLLLITLFSLMSIFVLAHGEETFAEAESIIKSKVPCDKLSDEQLEMLGDYYMEQMHPGEQHERMDEMMGGEGSETLREMHIRMGQAFYCGEHGMMSGGMMNMMMGRGAGMMPESQRIESQNINTQRAGMMSGGMMSGFGIMSGGMWLLWILYIAVAAFIVGIIFWWTYKLVMKK